METTSDEWMMTDPHCKIEERNSPPVSNKCTLLSLPVEILHEILAYIVPVGQVITFLQSGKRLRRVTGYSINLLLVNERFRTACSELLFANNTFDFGHQRYLLPIMRDVYPNICGQFRHIEVAGSAGYNPEPVFVLKLWDDFAKGIQSCTMLQTLRIRRLDTGASTVGLFNKALLDQEKDGRLHSLVFVILLLLESHENLKDADVFFNTVSRDCLIVRKGISRQTRSNEIKMSNEDLLIEKKTTEQEIAEAQERINAMFSFRK